MLKIKNRQIQFILIFTVVLMLVFLGDPFWRGLNLYQPSIDLPWEPKCEVPLLVTPVDHNQNGTPDALDLVAGARGEVRKRTRYDAAYYAGGYPPDGRGACTDVVWQAFKAAGYDLKVMVDEDIRRNKTSYGRTGERPDPNIDYRRVANLVVFFQRHGRELTTELIPGNVENLQEWQPGDIVTFGPRYEHIGIISDKRRRDGVPLLIHNGGPYASEGDVLERWPAKITRHYRFPPAK